MQYCIETQLKAGYFDVNTLVGAPRLIIKNYHLLAGVYKKRIAKIGKKINLSIIIPCFNEAKNVAPVLGQLEKLVKYSQENIEIIIIDGGSTDNTPKELAEVFKKLPPENFKLILNKKRGGYGGDIIQALSNAKGKVLAWTHADLQTDPYDVISAYESYKKLAIDNKKIFIKGARKNRRFMEVFFTLGMQIVSFLVLKKYLSDINAQPKLFDRNFYEKYLKTSYPGDFSLDLFALYQAKSNGYDIRTIPVFFKKRMHGEAKGGGGGWKMRLNLIKRTFKYIFELRKKIHKT